MDEPRGKRAGSREVFVASHNAGKLKEIAAALDGLRVRLWTPADFVSYPPPAEDGETFADNALTKAVAALDATGLPALADDSGLEVDALDGEPGVYSARFGGAGLDDEQRYALLLRRLDGVPRERRTARFRAVLALCTPGRPPAFFEGTAEGWIAFTPRGSGGFGYDPVFALRDEDGCFLERTMAELSPEEKHGISHRGRALRLLRRALEAGEVEL